MKKLTGYHEITQTSMYFAFFPVFPSQIYQVITKNNLLPLIAPMYRAEVLMHFLSNHVIFPLLLTHEGSSQYLLPRY